MIYFVILLLALISCYQDFKERKVKNWLIISALIIGAFFHDSLIPQLYQFALSLFIGFLMFISKWWAPGDAKLFATYAFLIPSGTVTFPIISWFPSLALLLNAIVPASLFYSIQILFTTSWKQKLKVIKSVDLQTKIVPVVLFLIIDEFSRYFTLPFNPILIFVMELLAVIVVVKSLEEYTNKLIKKYAAYLNALMVLLIIISMFFYDPLQIILTLLSFIILYTLFDIFTALADLGKTHFIPFSGWMALGVLLTILLQMNVLMWFILHKL